MYKAEVRIVEPQSEVTTQQSVSDYERNQLLLKYGFVNQSQPQKVNHFDPARDLSYQELMELEDRKLRELSLPTPPPIQTFSIDPNQVRHNDHKISSEDGLQLEIRVVSDMNIRGISR